MWLHFFCFLMYRVKTLKHISSIFQHFHNFLWTKHLILEIDYVECTQHFFTMNLHSYTVCLKGSKPRHNELCVPRRSIPLIRLPLTTKTSNNVLATVKHSLLNFSEHHSIVYVNIVECIPMCIFIRSWCSFANSGSLQPPSANNIFIIARTVHRRCRSRRPIVRSKVVDLVRSSKTSLAKGAEEKWVSVDRCCKVC